MSGNVAYRDRLISAVSVYQNALWLSSQYQQSSISDGAQVSTGTGRKAEMLHSG